MIVASFLTMMFSASNVGIMSHHAEQKIHAEQRLHALSTSFRKALEFFVVAHKMTMFTNQNDQ